MPRICAWTWHFGWDRLFFLSVHSFVRCIISGSNDTVRLESERARGRDPKEQQRQQHRTLGTAPTSCARYDSLLNERQDICWRLQEFQTSPRHADPCSAKSNTCRGLRPERSLVSWLGPSFHENSPMHFKFAPQQRKASAFGNLWQLRRTTLKAENSYFACQPQQLVKLEDP